MLFFSYSFKYKNIGMQILYHLYNYTDNNELTKTYN